LVSDKLEIKNRYESEAFTYLTKRKVYFSYVGTRMINVVNFAIKLASKTSDLKLLDVGSGSGFFERSIRDIKSNVKIWVSLDIAENVIRMQKDLSPGIDIMVADAEHPPFRDNVFDIVIISRSIKFVDPEKALGESARVSKKFFILFADVADTLWAQIMEQLIGINVDPAAWNNFRTPFSRKIETFLQLFFIIKAKVHVTAMPLSLFNRSPSFLVKKNSRF